MTNRENVDVMTKDQKMKTKTKMAKIRAFTEETSQLRMSLNSLAMKT